MAELVYAGEYDTNMSGLEITNTNFLAHGWICLIQRARPNRIIQVRVLSWLQKRLLLIHRRNRVRSIELEFSQVAELVDAPVQIRKRVVTLWGMKTGSACRVTHTWVTGSTPVLTTKSWVGKWSGGNRVRSTTWDLQKVSSLPMKTSCSFAV